MKTKTIKQWISTCIGLWLALPTAFAASGGYAPGKINSIDLELNVTTATYDDDLGPDTLTATAAGIMDGSFAYSLLSENVGRLAFFDLRFGPQTYTGTYDLTFETATTGTFLKTYTGTFTGTSFGTFRIISADVDARPMAVRMKVKVRANRSKKFRLEGMGVDIGQAAPEFKIVQTPSGGKLVTKNLPYVVYKPKRGFTGTVKFKYLVTEGTTESEVVTVTLQIVGVK